jgi:hypothetical protein
MNYKKQLIILLLIGDISCQRTVRNKASNLFSLEEDKLIINTPNVKDMHSAESNNEIFKIDESTPFKSGVFFMQDDFFVDVHEHADPPMNPYEFVPI